MTTGPGNYPPHISDAEWAQHDEDYREPDEPEFDNNEGDRQ